MTTAAATVLVHAAGAYEGIATAVQAAQASVGLASSTFSVTGCAGP